MGRLGRVAAKLLGLVVIGSCFEVRLAGQSRRRHPELSDVTHYDATYWYDDVGNIDQVKVRYGTGAFTTLDYQYGDAGHPTWLTQVTGGVSPWLFGYNGAGGMEQRTVDGPTQTLDYDARNRLVTVTDTAGATGLVYDADGNRIVRKTPATTTVYVGDLYERTTSGTETKRYVVGGVVVSQRVAGTLDVVVGDHLGSTSATYDTATGAVAKQWFEAFGAIRASVGDVATDVGYTGQRLDATTGLMFYRARSYDPVVGRFAQPDTIVPDPADHRDLNRYTYVRNNPVNYTDPTGA